MLCRNHTIAVSTNLTYAITTKNTKLESAIAGLGLSFFASEGSPYWVLIGTVAGALSGYFIEKKVF